MKPGMKFLPEDFELTDSTLSWLQEKHPTVDVAETIEIFQDKARAKAWAYRCWQSAFRNYIRNGQKFGGVTYKNGIEHDPRWQQALHEARKFGFRDPEKMETPASYRTAFEQWQRAPRSNVLNFGQVLKRVAT